MVVCLRHHLLCLLIVFFAELDRNLTKPCLLFTCAKQAGSNLTEGKSASAWEWFMRRTPSVVAGGASYPIGI